MSARAFLTNIAIVLSVMALGALIETVVPMFAAGTRTRGRRTANLGLTAAGFLVNWLLASIAAMAALILRPDGILASLQIAGWIQLVVGILILDFSVGYL